MDRQEIRAQITEVFLRKVKLVANDETTYYGTPSELISDLLDNLQEHEIVKAD